MSPNVNPISITSSKDVNPQLITVIHCPTVFLHCHDDLHTVMLPCYTTITNVRPPSCIILGHMPFNIVGVLIYPERES